MIVSLRNLETSHCFSLLLLDNSLLLTHSVIHLSQSRPQYTHTHTHTRMHTHTCTHTRMHTHTHTHTNHHQEHTHTPTRTYTQHRNTGSLLLSFLVTLDWTGNDVTIDAQLLKWFYFYNPEKYPVKWRLHGKHFSCGALWWLHRGARVWVFMLKVCCMRFKEKWKPFDSFAILGNRIVCVCVTEYICLF